MARRGMLVACGILMLLGSTVYVMAGRFGPPRSCNPQTCRDAAWHYRTAQPQHWRHCMLAH